MNQNKIAIIGLSARFPESDTLLALHRFLAEGKQCVKDVPAERLLLQGQDPSLKHAKLGILQNVDCFDNKFWNIGTKEAVQMSPEQRISLETAAEAVLNAGYALERFKGENCGVILSCSNNNYEDKIRERSTISFLGSHAFMAASYISYYLDLHGPNMLLDTGCSSSLLCIHEACTKLNQHEADYFLAGGTSVYLHIPDEEHDFKLGVEAQGEQIRPFDAEADGIYSGEGCGFVLLKRYEDAVRDRDHIYGIICGSYVNNDGARSSSVIAPSVDGQKEAVTGAWKHAGIDPAEITEIEAHGTGTKLGDPIEIESMTESFEAFNVKPHDIMLGTVKANLGHTLYTAGVAGVIRKLLEFETDWQYPLANFRTPNPLIDFDRAGMVPSAQGGKYQSDRLRLAGLNAFSFSGTNVHMLIAQAQKPDAAPETVCDANNCIVKFSAKSEEAFYSNLKLLKAYLTAFPRNINDVVYTLNTGRDDFKFRRMIRIRNAAELLEKLDYISHVRDMQQTKIAYLIAGDAAHPIPQQAAKQAERLAALGLRADYILADQTGKAIADILDGNGSAADAEAALKHAAFAPESEYEKKRTALMQNLRQLAEKEPVIAINLSDPAYDPQENSSVRSFRADSPDAEQVLLTEVYNTGRDLCFDAYYQGFSYRKVPLSEYCFDKTHLWGTFVVNELAAHAQAETPAAEPAAESVELTEDALRTIWVNILGCDETISAEDDFFELGGDSILIGMLLEDIESACGVRLTTEDIYTYATLGSQLAYIRQSMGAGESAAAEPEDQPEKQDTETNMPAMIPMNTMQKLVYYSQKNQPTSPQWNLSFPLRLTGKIDPDRLERAAIRAAANHDILCSVVEAADGVPYFAPSGQAQVAIERRDFSEELAGGKPSDAIEDEIRTILKQEAMDPIEPEHTPLLKLYLYRVSDELAYMMLRFNHICVDGWSAGVFLQEMCEYFKDPDAKIEGILPFAELYQKSLAKQEADLAYWKQIVAGCNSPKLFPVTKETADAGVHTVKYMIVGKGAAARARAFCKDYKATEYQYMLMIFHLTVARLYGRKDHIISTVLSNRADRAAAKTIGFIANDVTSRLPLDDEMTVETLLEQARNQAISAQSHQSVCLGDYLCESLDAQKPSLRDLTDFLLVYQNFEAFGMDIDGMNISGFMMNERAAFTPLSMIVLGANEGVVGSVEYDTALITEEEADRFIKTYKEIYAAVSRDKDLKVRELIYERKDI